MIEANSWCGNGGHLVLQWDVSSGFYPISAWTYIKSALIAQNLPEPDENYLLIGVFAILIVGPPANADPWHLQPA